MMLLCLLLFLLLAKVKYSFIMITAALLGSTKYRCKGGEVDYFVLLAFPHFSWFGPFTIILEKSVVSALV